MKHFIAQFSLANSGLIFIICPPVKWVIISEELTVIILDNVVYVKYVFVKFNFIYLRVKIIFEVQYF